MRTHLFKYTKASRLNEHFELPPSDKGGIPIDLVLPILKRYPILEPWGLDNDHIYRKYDIDSEVWLQWRCLTFHILKNGQKVPESNISSRIEYVIKGGYIGVTLSGEIIPDELKVFYSIAVDLGLNLLYENLDILVTPKYIERLEKKQTSIGPKLTQKQDAVLGEVDADATWIYLPGTVVEDVLTYLKQKSKESEIVSGLYKAFEKNYIGLACYKGNVILFGNNITTLPIPDFNTKLNNAEDIVSKIVQELSSKFGEAQYYTYNEYEANYIHYKNGELVYAGWSGDGGNSHDFGSLTELIELSPQKIKSLSEENGIALEDFLIGCMKEKIKCHLIASKSGAQSWWDGIMGNNV